MGSKSHKITSTTIIILFLLSIAIFFTYPLAGDGDFFHHVNTGRHILENSEIPRTDIWTFSVTGRPWVAYAWGMGVIYYFLFQTLGPDGISLLGSAIAVLTFWLLYTLLRNYGVSRLVTIVALATAAPLLANRWPNRPELVTYPMVVTLLLIDRLRQQRPKLALLTPLLFLLWTNLYGSSVFVGLGILVCNALVKRSRFVSVATLLSFAAAFINPFGWRSISYIFVIPEVAKIQGEWSGIIETLRIAPITYLLPFQYRVLLYGGYLLLFGLLSLFSIGVIFRLPLLTTYAFTLFLPIFIFRHLPLGIVLSIPLFGIMLEKKKIFLPILAFFIPIALSLSIWINRPGLGIDPNDYPKELIAFLKKFDIGGRVYNTQQVGSFLTFYFYPKMLVYSDTRDDLFVGTPVYSTISDIFARQTSILPFLDSQKIDTVIVDLSEGPPYQALFNSPNWAPVYLGGHYGIFVKPSLAKEKNMPIYSAIDPFRPTMAKIDKVDQATQEYQSLLPLEPNFINNKLRLATTLFYSNKFDEVIATLSDFPLQNNPRTPMFFALRDYLLVQSHFAKGDCDNTKRYLDSTWAHTHGKFLFTPDRIIPSQVNKGYAFFFLSCKQDLVTARRYLDSYLGEADVEPAEKLRTSQIFNAQIFNAVTLQ